MKKSQQIFGKSTTQHNTVQEHEEFALAWLRATFEQDAAMTSRIGKEDLYKMYSKACLKTGQKRGFSQRYFPQCVRKVFGGIVGPKQTDQNKTSSFFYESIRIRAQPLAMEGSILVNI